MTQPDRSDLGARLTSLRAMPFPSEASTAAPALALSQRPNSSSRASRAPRAESDGDPVSMASSLAAEDDDIGGGGEDGEGAAGGDEDPADEVVAAVDAAGEVPLGVVAAAFNVFPGPIFLSF